MAKLIENLTLTNRFHELGEDLSVRSMPEGISCSTLVKFNRATAQIIGLSPDLTQPEKLLEYFSGNQILKNSKPVAHAYAGHQFGKFTPFLGDGRSVILGDLDSDNGTWEIMLKGSGKTPFTFASDGLASLSECLHEYEMSKRLVEMGVPTTHSLCVIQGSERVYRSGYEPTAILTRVAPSHIRFGTFENCYFKKNTKALKRLTDFVIENHFPECLGDNVKDKGNYAQFFREVVVRTARLIAQWQNSGFVHGMMNTDNQSILGITLDHGESVFIENYDDEFVAASSDEHGRYAFGNQPAVGLWNCNVLARALTPLISSIDLKAALSTYEPTYLNHH
jgi:uncharacterized protein YdiU (UPF0061 family)